MTTDIKSQSRDDLAAWLRARHHPAYRTDQVLRWLYRRRVVTWDAMKNLPGALRQELATTFTLHGARLVTRQGSEDATQKFLWELSDRALIESVLIPANPALYGDRSDRHTLCVSTQVGCAYGCRFCASGLAGWKRDLTADEIVEQVLATERWHSAQSGGPGPADHSQPAAQTPSQPTPASPGRIVDNIVVMGMGEPLANYENLLQAIRILNAPWGGGIGARKITLSTSGLAPQIRRLADEPLQVGLAISLHGATDAVRSRIMPINRRYPLAELTGACLHYLQRKGRLITLEYILIAGVNDDRAQTQPLATLARRLRAKVNLIPYNRVQGLDWERPSEEAQEAFYAALVRAGVKATLRREKGHDIDAACGQLRLKTERALAAGAGQAVLAS